MDFGLERKRHVEGTTHSEIIMSDTFPTNWSDFRAMIEPELEEKRPKTMESFLESRSREETRYVCREQNRERTERMRWIRRQPRQNRRAIR